MNGSDPCVVDLQLRFMKLERELAELSAVVAVQQRTIDALKHVARSRRERDTQDEPGAGDEPPPHY
jgi:hypothetical protein